MPVSALTGSRIRERRMALGLRQSGLAKTVGISPAYLNLIEHNKRRIGGKLLVALARELQIDAGQLAEGTETALVASLRDAAAREPGSGVEDARAEEFAGQFPGWAALLAAQTRRIARLEHAVEILSDRMAHDPHLAASLHDLLSTVTAISSTASILVETGDIEPEWRDRFHRNIFEDSARLATGAQALVGYLDAASEAELGVSSPQGEVEQWLEARGYHLAELEQGSAPGAADLLQGAAEIASAAGRALAERYLARYLTDAARMPLPAFGAAVDEMRLDPLRLADRFDADLAAVLRRIACLPEAPGQARCGLAVCDGSGTLTFRKPVDGFALPRLGAACPLWPLYQALARPLTPIRAVVEMAGRDAVRFLCYAIAQPTGPAGFDAPPVIEATMLIVPGGRGVLPDLAAQPIGSSCRICPREACAARREPSVLTARAEVQAGAG